MMKKNYEKPTVEVVKFQYRDQVVVASACHYHVSNTSPIVNVCDAPTSVPNNAI